MRARPHCIGLVCLVAFLALPACDSFEGDDEVSDLTAQWCPASGEVIWALEFGEGPVGMEPMPWTGDYGYSLAGERSGAGGGRGSSHGCCAGIAPEGRWRLSETVSLGGRPQSLRVTVGGVSPQQRPGLSLPQTRRFLLSTPERSPHAEGPGCILMDVQMLDATE
ncbi:MAG: hypothetical protein VYE15_05075 [Myxococcota bacterium]|nr:hypothetical protein [Myxococcota bacterium]